jgi:hypothetical protein
MFSLGSNVRQNFSLSPILLREVLGSKPQINGNYETSNLMLHYGYAISMRGESLTCGKPDYQFLEGLRPFLRQVKDLQKAGVFSASQRLAAHQSGKAAKQSNRAALGNRFPLFPTLIRA